MAKNKSAQEGRVLILVVIFMFTLSAFWVIALSMTGSELSFVGGRKTASQQFYYAEAGAAAVIDTISTNVPTGPWATAFKDVTIKVSINNDEAKVTVRPIQNVDATAAENNKLPVQEHEFDPPEGSGSGVNTAVARRYAIASAAGGKIVQVGVYRVVPK